MSLKTRFGNLANILDQDSGRDRVLVLDTPVLTSNDWLRLKAHFGAAAAEIDCTFDMGSGPDGLRAAIAHVRAEAEQAIREGRSELFLTEHDFSLFHSNSMPCQGIGTIFGSLPWSLPVQVDRKSVV